MKSIRCFFCVLFLCVFFTANPVLAANNVCPTGGERHSAEFTFCPTHGVKLVAAPDSTPKKLASSASPELACKVNDPDIGQSYKGECVNGLAHGEGTASGRDTYAGSFRNGNKVGHGVYTWGSGSKSAGAKYEGGWSEDKMLGYGVQTWPDGGKYEGLWLEGKKSLTGVYTWADGSRYAGGWKDDKRDGYGIQLSPDDIKNKISLRSRFAMWENNERSFVIDLDRDDSYDAYLGIEPTPQLIRYMEQDAFERCRKALAEVHVAAARKQQGAEALQSLQQAEDVDPTYSDIYELRAKIVAKGDSIKALQDAIKALAQRDLAKPALLASLPKINEWLQQPAFNEFLTDLLGSKIVDQVRQKEVQKVPKVPEIPETIVLGNKERGLITLPHKEHYVNFTCSKCHGDTIPGPMEFGREKLQGLPREE